MRRQATPTGGIRPARSGGASALVLPSATVLQGFTVVVTGFDAADYVKVAKLATVLGAQIETTVSPRAACLIAKAMGAPQCDLAYKLNIPIVGVQYLQETQQQQKLLLFENFSLPPFHKMIITCTGMSLEARLKLKTCIEELGGRFVVNLEKDVTTHLVAAEPRGDKFQYAHSWGNVHVVTAKWIDECVRQRRWLPEVLFGFDASTPQTDPEQLSSAVSTAPSGLGRDDGVVGQSDRPTPNEPIGVTAVTDGDIHPTQRPPRSRKRKNTLLDLLEDFESHLLQDAAGNLPSMAEFRSDRVRSLRRQTVFVHGHTREVHDFIVRCVLRAGGHVSMAVTQATHLVALGPRTPDLLRRQVLQHPADLQQVGLAWLLENFFPPEAWETVVQSWRYRVP